MMRFSLLILVLWSLLLSISFAGAIEGTEKKANPGVHSSRNKDDSDNLDDIDWSDSEYDNEEDSLSPGASSVGKEKISVGKEKISESLGSKSVAKPKRALLFIRKNPVKVVVASVLLYKLRRTIFKMLFRLIADQVYDPATGKLIRQSVRPDKVIQLCFALYILKSTLLSDDDESEDSMGEPSVRDAFLFGPSGVRHSLLFGKLLKSNHLRKRNPSYLPLPTQHYTFESLNNRYSRDQVSIDSSLA